MWVGTFHGIAHRLLKMHWQEAKLAQTFQILDSDDQLRVVKRVYQELSLDVPVTPLSRRNRLLITKKMKAYAHSILMKVTILILR